MMRGNEEPPVLSVFIGHPQSIISMITFLVEENNVRGRSTIDAITHESFTSGYRVFALVKDALSRSRFLLLVSLNIDNAYIIVSIYLADRHVSCKSRAGACRRRMTCNVSQGTRLRPGPTSGVRIDIGRTIRYLELLLNGRWQFDLHFQSRVPNLMKTATVLGDYAQPRRPECDVSTFIHRRGVFDGSTEPQFGQIF
ncbi:hypothetical protein EVAR_44921_1 [Eumeta japonica]|uniref:Uncharacterized protein n=1 Tax=Eumeta variegata TaxID=151549 RepID=A0A4C1XNN2_EUMVA|nr:hypothetical protein EVAR_44921_1 [Eumeta japonica]